MSDDGRRAAIGAPFRDTTTSGLTDAPATRVRQALEPMCITLEEHSA